MRAHRDMKKPFISATAEELDSYAFGKLNDSVD